MAYRLRPSGKTMLAIAYGLEKRRKCASMDGLIKLARGIVDEETKPFQKMVGFASLLSLSPKKAKVGIHTLVHHGYLDQIYKEGDYFLRLSKLGRQEATLFLPKLETTSFKESKKAKPTITALPRKGE